MFLTSIRYSETEESTLDILLIDQYFECFLLEPPPGKRIPSGIHRLELYRDGELHREYLKKYPDFHQGMILIKVKGGSGVEIHIGNWRHQTEGCLLTGTTVNNNQLEPGRTFDSEDAYIRAYRKILPALLTPQESWLCVGTPVELLKFEPFNGGENHVRNHRSS